MTRGEPPAESHRGRCARAATGLEGSFLPFGQRGARSRRLSRGATVVRALPGD